MLIIPAIDLQNGRCVRLKQGQFSQVTSFDVDPITRATYFANLGAKRLHIVDLDGARTGSMQQMALICAMNHEGMELQVGGGIRSLAQAKQCIAAGISYLVIGSIAITDPQLTIEIIKQIGAQHIILALDVNIRDGLPIPASHGWLDNAEHSLWDLVDYYQNYGIQHILCTDIACDGMMTGPNFNLYREAIRRFPTIQWQASGGIRNQQDLNELANLGMAAAILGLTLYRGDLDLAQSLKEAELC